MTIPYARPYITDEDVAAVELVLRGQWLTTGPTVDRFEDALTAVTSARYAVSVSSGTAALHALYAGLGLRQGMTLVVPALTFAATAYPALMLGASVLFADIDDRFLTLDPDAVDAIDLNVDVIAAVHYAGVPANVIRLRDTATRKDATMIEDAAHAIGSSWEGEPCGSIGHAAAFSFHAVKTVTTGEGGAVTTDDEALAERVRRFRNHGITRNRDDLVEPDAGDWHRELQSWGLNYRLTDLQAALGISQMRRLSATVAERRRLVERYNELFDNVEEVTTPSAPAEASVAWHLYPLRVLDGRRGAVFDHLRNNGIGVQVHYLPVYRHPLFQELGYRTGMCPVAERVYDELISLPLYVGLTDADQDRVVEEILVAVS
ncbi:MAG: DegT/DnrJ/EryC1/StrS family aminotransferase [Actinomycetota bacterium]|nr:DegT/DnrJ/EryC1/StrS family aminotransferase [Actinomycetota bacterium]